MASEEVLKWGGVGVTRMISLHDSTRIRWKQVFQDYVYSKAFWAFFFFFLLMQRCKKSHLRLRVKVKGLGFRVKVGARVRVREGLGLRV
jgi:hypothetical protein